MRVSHPLALQVDCFHLSKRHVGKTRVEIEKKEEEEREGEENEFGTTSLTLEHAAVGSPRDTIFERLSLNTMAALISVYVSSRRSR